MNLIQKYIEYLKDNPEHYWFKRKILGWGWTPATWEGWLVTAVFTFLIVGNAVRFEYSVQAGQEDITFFLMQTVALIALLIVVAWRTGEPPKWQWGFPKKDQ